MTELSPAAQAVLDAYEKSNDCYREEWGQLAAALCAAAEECAGLPDGSDCTNLLTEIASELEAQ